MRDDEESGGNGPMKVHQNKGVSVHLEWIFGEP
jgi:hypothetical protein